MYIGVDQSFTNTGIVVLDDNGNLVESISKSFSNKKKSEQYEEIYSFFSNIANKYPDAYYALEDYAFGKMFKRERMGEMRAIIVLSLLHNNIHPYIIPIKTHRKVLTGNGNAKKEYARLFINKTLGIILKNLDEYDAYSIAYSLRKYKNLSKSFGDDITLYGSITYVE